MMTYEERKKSLLKSLIFDNQKTFLVKQLYVLENQKVHDVQVVFNALHSLYYSLNLSYEIVKGLISYFWSSKMHQAWKLFEQARSNGGKR